jgi:O-acetyl-ADP-ribose deacetylase (regulator of RNase III)
MSEIEVRQADITTLEVDAIANAANTQLKHGGGVAAAIVPKWVIHAATMELGGPTSAEIIRSATASTLRRADQLGATSLGLVAFGTGVGGFPLEDAARIEVEEVRRHLDEGSKIERVVFAVFGEEAREAFEGAVYESG